ncbi:hypothetical protein MKX01_032264 [Papaver californicum]|nr:hypothetical protein MKX01_032264 [Papaver californicum]
MEHTLQPHVILMPSPGMGHLITTTLIVATQTNSPFKAVKLALELNSLPASINTIFLPPVDINDLPSDTEIEAQMSAIVTRSHPALTDSLRTITSNHGVVSFVLYSCEFRDVPDMIQIPGCVPIRGIDLTKPLRDRKIETYESFIHYWKKLNLGRGIFLNSFDEIEHGALNGKQWDNPPVYAIGPLLRTMGVRDDGSDVSGCLRWLDNQSLGSVLFVSFGSGGTLSGEQLTELALGLEMSEQKFLWFFKSPILSGKAANTFYLMLPKGFLDRTRNSGLVVSSWVPQIQILDHGSTGGFLTHCGWNSTLEIIVHGVLLIACPLFAEQAMNAVMLTDDMKVVIRPKPMKNGIIGRDEICKVVKQLKEELKCAATSILAEAGSSAKTFAEAVSAWKNH